MTPKLGTRGMVSSVNLRAAVGHSAIPSSGEGTFSLKVSCGGEASPWVLRTGRLPWCRSCSLCTLVSTPAVASREAERRKTEPQLGEWECEVQVPTMGTGMMPLYQEAKWKPHQRPGTSGGAVSSEPRW